MIRLILKRLIIITTIIVIEFWLMFSLPRALSGSIFIASTEHEFHPANAARIFLIESDVARDYLQSQLDSLKRCPPPMDVRQAQLESTRGSFRGLESELANEYQQWASGILEAFSGCMQMIDKLSRLATARSRSDASGYFSVEVEPGSYFILSIVDSDTADIHSLWVDEVSLRGEFSKNILLDPLNEIYTRGLMPETLLRLLSGTELSDPSVMDSLRKAREQISRLLWSSASGSSAG